MSPLATFFLIGAVISLIAVVGSFLFGIVAMTRGREQDHATSNKMMKIRVYSQGAVLLFLLLAFLAN